MVEEEVAGQLVQRARAEGLTLTGPDGLLGRLTKMVLETALDAEMTEHRGDEPPERAGGSNACNGTRAKTVRTEVGPVGIDVPRDRDSSFEPKIVANQPAATADRCGRHGDLAGRQGADDR